MIIHVKCTLKNSSSSLVWRASSSSLPESSVVEKQFKSPRAHSRMMGNTSLLAK